MQILAVVNYYSNNHNHDDHDRRRFSYIYWSVHEKIMSMSITRGGLD